MERINARRLPAVHATITPGEAVAGMIRHGLGFAHRPLSLPPQFGARSPRELWCREGVEAEMCNRCTLGRTLDAAYASGGALLLQERALAVWAHAGLDLRGNHRDTTRVARSGEDLPEGEAQAMMMPHGCATAHRPDLNPAVLELLGSHDGGGPCVSNSGDGHTADSPVGQARARGWRTAWQHAPSPRDVIADATRAHGAKAPNLQARSCLPRLPHTLGVVSPVIMPALTGERGHWLDEPTRAQGVEGCPDGSAPRWWVVCSQAALARAAASVTTARPRAYAAIAKPCVPLQAQRFATPAAAHQALAVWAQAGP